MKLVIYGHSMGTGVGSRAVAEVTNDKSIRVDGVILDSPMHSAMYALKQAPNFLYYSSFIFDWQKFLEVAGIEFNVAKVRYILYSIFAWHDNILKYIQELRFLKIDYYTNYYHILVGSDD